VISCYCRSCWYTILKFVVIVLTLLVSVTMALKRFIVLRAVKVINENTWWKNSLGKKDKYEGG